MERRQRVWARIAGFLFLWLIVTGLAGALTISHIEGSGTFAETARRVAASERLYRVALSSELVETLSALLLAFALYVTLEPANPFLARLAMYWRIGESFIGGVGMVFGFIRLHVYMSAPSMSGVGSDPGQALVGLTHSAGVATYNIAAICFGVGSAIFFWLFFKSRYVPRVLSVLGLVSSVIVPVICFGALIFPEHASTLRYGWAPMALAEVATGIWLMAFSVKAPRASEPTAIAG